MAYLSESMKQQEKPQNYTIFPGKVILKYYYRKEEFTVVLSLTYFYFL